MTLALSILAALGWLLALSFWAAWAARGDELRQMRFIASALWQMAIGAPYPGYEEAARAAEGRQRGTH